MTAQLAASNLYNCKNKSVTCTTLVRQQPLTNIPRNMISDEQYLKTADEAYAEALETVRSSDGWKVEKEDKENNVLVEMKKNKNGKKIYRCKVSIK